MSTKRCFSCYILVQKFWKDRPTKKLKPKNLLSSFIRNNLVSSFLPTYFWVRSSDYACLQPYRVTFSHALSDQTLNKRRNGGMLTSCSKVRRYFTYRYLFKQDDWAIKSGLLFMYSELFLIIFIKILDTFNSGAK